MAAGSTRSSGRPICRRNGRLGLHSQCGQCINVCPTAAFLEKSGSTEDVWKAIADPEMHVVVQTAPSIRAAIGEGFNHAAGHARRPGEMITALRRLGFRRRVRHELRRRPDHCGRGE